MSPEDSAVHHRLDTLENTIASSFGKLTAAVEKLVVLETEHKATRDTLARYGQKIDNHDVRLDTVEKKVPLYDAIVEEKRANSILIRRSVIGTLISLVVVGIAGLVWSAIVNQ